MYNKLKIPRVVYWNNIPTPYFVDRFNALVDRGKLNFEAWFNARIEPDRNWEVNERLWHFPYQYIPSFKIVGRRIRFPLHLLNHRPPNVLVSLYAEPVFLLGWAIARIRGSRTMFRTLKTYDRWVKRRAWKETIKRFIFSRVDGVETHGRDGRDFAMKYGACEEKIFYTTHAIDIEHYMKSRTIALHERERFRGELGLQGITFIYVGRLILKKGIDYLLDAFHEFQSHIDKKSSLLLVGDGADENSLKDKCIKNGISNVVFAGFKQKYELPRYYAASDVFVFPTLGDPYGLVVDEAMACSLPVISTNAAGEISDRIEDGVNGYIVPPENSFLLFKRMEKLACNEALRKEMGKFSLKKIMNHTPEKWAEDFEKAVLMVLNG